MLVQAHAFRQVDVYFVGGRDTTNQIMTAAPALLRNSDDGWNHVSGMIHIRSEERIVEIQLAHRGTVGPRRPFAGDALSTRQAEHGRAAGMRMRDGLRARVRHRAARETCHSNTGVVDDAIDHHVDHIAIKRRIVRGNCSKFPRQQFLARRRLCARINAHAMILHVFALL